MRIAVCHPQTPFATGGAEAHTSALISALRDAGHEAEQVSMPFKWYPPEELIHQMASWRSVDLSESSGQQIDAVIALKFPAYLVPHKRKVVWLMQQYHPAYELWEHPSFGSLAKHQDGDRLREMIWTADGVAFAEAQRLFTTSRNVKSRLERSLGFRAEALYHRSRLCDALMQLTPGPYGDYVLLPSRFEDRKRQGLLVEAMRLTKSDVRLVLVGKGPEERVLRRRIRESGVESRVEIRTNVSDEELIGLYQGALAVCYPPLDEDYGYVTLEGMAAARPVVTATDSGGPLEFIQDEETGLVVEANPWSLAEALDRLRLDPSLTRRLGAAGHDVVRRAVPDWHQVVEQLIG